MAHQQKGGFPRFTSILKNNILPFLLPSKYPNIGIVLAGGFGLSFLLQMIWQEIPDEKLFFSKTSLIGFSLITLFRLMALLLVYVLVTQHYKIQEHHTLGRNPGLGGLFIAFITGVPAMLISIGIHNLFIYFELKSGNPIPPQLYYYISSESSVYGILLMMIMTVIFPIIIEELFFRGLVFAVLPDKWWIRILVPAVLSSLFAVNRLEFLSFLVIGLCCSFVRYFTDNMLCSCLTRAGFFCTKILMASILPTQDPSEVQNAIDFDRMTIYASMIGIILGIVMILVLIRQLRLLRYLQKNEDMRCESEEGKPLSIPLREHFHIDFVLGIAFLALCWIMS